MMSNTMDGQVTLSDPGLWFGKMCQELSALQEKIEEGKTLDAYSKKFAELKIKMPQYLCLKTEDGQQVGASWDTESTEYLAWLGEYMTHSFGEYPKEERESHLSQILEGGAAPEVLFERKSVSRNTTESEEERKTTSETTRGSVDKAISFQERAGKPGGGKGILIQNDRVGSLSTCNTQKVLANTLNPWDSQSKQICREDGVANALYAGESRYGGGEAYVMQDSKCYGISSYDSNSMKSSNPHSGIYEADTTRTLDNNGGNPACNQGGMAIVCKEPYTSSKNSHHTKFTDDGKASTLVAPDYKDPPTVGVLCEVDNNKE